MNANMLSNPNYRRFLKTAAIAAFGATALTACAADAAKDREDRVVDAIEHNLTTFEYESNGLDHEGQIEFYDGELDVTGNVRETIGINDDSDHYNKADEFADEDVVFENPIVVTPNTIYSSERWAGAQTSDGEWYWAKVNSATDTVLPDRLHTEPVGDSTLQINK